MIRSSVGRLLAVVMLAFSLLPTPLTGGLRATFAQGSNNSVPGQVIVKLNPASGATIADIHATYGTTTIANLAPALGIYLLATPTGVSAQQLIGQMEGDTRLLYAELNYIGDAPEGNPRSIGAWAGTSPGPYDGQYAVGMLGLAAAHQISTGANTVVAVLDTGAQLDHPALANSWTAARYNFVEGNAVPADVGNGQDDDADGAVDEMVGHGTHVAGIIHLVAPDAKLMPIRVLDSDGHGEFFALAEAIDYAVDNGANVINLSLGTSDRSDTIEEAIRRATERGVVVVAAAGNLNSQEQQYPAAAQCALPVTSTNAADTKSSFSNFGSWVDFAAPGEAIYSAFPPSGYASWNGTSMATPFVAGQTALLRSKAPSANPRQIATLIGLTAKSIDQLNPNYQGELGQGRIDIGASVAYLVDHGMPASGGGIISGSCVGEVEGGQARWLLPMIRS
jgi:thermitase